MKKFVTTLIVSILLFDSLSLSSVLAACTGSASSSCSHSTLSTCNGDSCCDWQDTDSYCYEASCSSLSDTTCPTCSGCSLVTTTSTTRPTTSTTTTMPSCPYSCMQIANCIAASGSCISGYYCSSGCCCQTPTTTSSTTSTTTTTTAPTKICCLFSDCETSCGYYVTCPDGYYDCTITTSTTTTITTSTTTIAPSPSTCSGVCSAYGYSTSACLATGCSGYPKCSGGTYYYGCDIGEPNFCALPETESCACMNMQSYTCEWNNLGCNLGGCTASQMRQTTTCTVTACSGDGRCVDDSYGSWYNQQCGGTCGTLTCASNQMCQRRTSVYGCLPPDYQCVSDTCGSWIDAGCGQSGCTASQWAQTRTCTFNCDATTRCLADSYLSWSNYGCGSCGTLTCTDFQVCQRRTSTYNCLSPQYQCVDCVLDCGTRKSECKIESGIPDCRCGDCVTPDDCEDGNCCELQIGSKTSTWGCVGKTSQRTVGSKYYICDPPEWTPSETRTDTSSDILKALWDIYSFLMRI